MEDSKKGIMRIRLARLCFEKDPMRCHRHVLGEELRKHGAEATIE